MTRPTQQHLAFVVLATLGGFLGTSVTILTAALTFGDRMWVPRQDFEDMRRSVESQLSVIKFAVCQSHPCFDSRTSARR